MAGNTAESKIAMTLWALAGLLTAISCALPARVNMLQLVSDRKIPIPTGISLDHSSLSILAGHTAPLTATLTPPEAAGNKITWTSSNTSVATVTSAGVVKAVASSGIATIRATAGGVSAICMVTCLDAIIPVVSIAISPTSLNYLLTGPAQQLLATFIPATATDKGLSWSTSDPTIATVSATGLVQKGSSAGGGFPATITVTSQDGGHVATCLVTFTHTTVPVTSVLVSPVSKSLALGQTASLSAAITPATATDVNVTWSSADSSRVSVSSSGVVTAVAVTTSPVVVTATTHDGGFVSSSNISVVVPVTGVNLNKAALSVSMGTTDTSLVATVLPATASNPAVTWTTSDSTVATVGATGAVHGVGVGSAAIRATTDDGSFSANCSVSVVNPVTSVTETITALKLNVGEQCAIPLPTVSPATATNKTLSWASANSSVVSVTGDASHAHITGVASGGPFNITATTTDGSALSVVIAVTVSAPIAPAPVFTAVPSYSGAAMAIDEATGIVYIAYVDSAQKGILAHISGSGTWVTDGPSFGTAVQVDPSQAKNLCLAVNGSHPVVAYIDGTVANKVSVKSYDSGTLTWTPLTVPPAGGGNSHHLSLAVDSSAHVPFVIFNEANPFNYLDLVILPSTPPSIVDNVNVTPSTWTAAAYNNGHNFNYLTSTGLNDYYSIGFIPAGPVVRTYYGASMATGQGFPLIDAGFSMPSIALSCGYLEGVYLDSAHMVQYFAELPSQMTSGVPFFGTSVGAGGTQLGFAADSRDGSAYIVSDKPDGRLVLYRWALDGTKSIVADNIDGVSGVNALKASFYVDGSGNGHLFVLYATPTSLVVKKYDR